MPSCRQGHRMEFQTWMTNEVKEEDAKRRGTEDEEFPDDPETLEGCMDILKDCQVKATQCHNEVAEYEKGNKNFSTMPSQISSATTPMVNSGLSNTLLEVTRPTAYIATGES
ncbi:hypothetical protein PENANT_c010G03085 [Penicillium antarcticum]|uniref:Uncharacterized protein n=1 Tax=Penicillium antarcticum TaxID=416450 RepID=A0A1V6Q8D7_9EURO|nr:hypothetical protein PENANT_c010G03085 [Penicillium antarcticum]